MRGADRRRREREGEEDIRGEDGKEVQTFNSIVEDGDQFMCFFRCKPHLSLLTTGEEVNKERREKGVRDVRDR